MRGIWNKVGITCYIPQGHFEHFSVRKVKSSHHLTKSMDMHEHAKVFAWQVKASCASLLEQIAALQAAHEEAGRAMAKRGQIERKCF